MMGFIPPSPPALSYPPTPAPSYSSFFSSLALLLRVCEKSAHLCVTRVFGGFYALHIWLKCGNHRKYDVNLCLMSRWLREGERRSDARELRKWVRGILRELGMKRVRERERECVCNKINLINNYCNNNEETYL